MSVERKTATVIIVGRAIILGGMLLCQLALAQEMSEDAWQFRAIVYGYFPSLGGSTSFPSSGSSIDLSTHQIISDLKFAFMGAIEAQKGPWGGFTDIMYIDVGGSKSGTRDLAVGGAGLPVGITANASLDIHGLTWTLAGEFRGLSTSQASIDAFAGARLLHLKENLHFAFSADVGPFAGAGREGSNEASLDNWDGIVGLKGRFDVGAARKVFIPFYIDAGAGDSRLTWQAIVGVGYKFAWGDVIAAWRYLDYDFKSGRDIESLRLNGPAIGAAFRW
jgi:hypothetical protein